MVHFDSDYMRGAHPQVLRRLLETNLEQTAGYGADSHTQHAAHLILRACGLEEGRVYFLMGGTQTNATVIDALLSRHEGVVAADSGHINVHEAGAVEAWGHKVLTLPAHDGKLLAAEVEHYIEAFYRDTTYPHMVAPGMVYITHPTELGTLYSLSELEALSAVCRQRGIPLFLDGARLGYGLAADTDVTLRDVAHLCDVFYIGGTKVGALFGEAVVTASPKLLPHFFSLVKQHGALLAKGRLLGVQFETLFTDDLYLRISRNAVEQAMRLKGILLAHGFRQYIDSPSNQQFFLLPNEVIDRLSRSVSFELWGARGEVETPVRFVTDWATTDAELEAVDKALREEQLG